MCQPKKPCCCIVVALVALSLSLCLDVDLLTYCLKAPFKKYARLKHQNQQECSAVSVNSPLKSIWPRAIVDISTLSTNLIIINYLFQF